MKKLILIISFIVLINFAYGVRTWKVIGEFGPFTNTVYTDLEGYKDTLYLAFSNNTNGYIYKYENKNWAEIGSFNNVTYLNLENQNNLLLFSFKTPSSLILKIYYYDGSWSEILLPPTYEFLDASSILNSFFKISRKYGTYLSIYNGSSWSHILLTSYVPVYNVDNLKAINNKVYILYEDVNYYSNMAEWDGNTLTQIGYVGITGTSYTHISDKNIAIDLNSNIYCIVLDTYGDARIQMYSSGNWSNIGIFEAFPSLKIVSNSPYLYFVSGTSPYRPILAKYLGNGNWSSEEITIESAYPGESNNMFYTYNEDIYIGYVRQSDRKLKIMAYTEDYTPTITPTFTITLTPTITPTITPTQDIIYYRTTLSTWIEGSVYMDSPTGVTRVSILDRKTWFKDKYNYSVFACRDRVQPNTYLLVVKNDNDIEFKIVDKTTLNLVDCSSNTCLIHFSVFKEP